jgi:hypothetical protein
MFRSALGLALFCFVVSIVAAQNGRTMVIPKDDQPFAVTPDDVVRLAAPVVAGGRVVIKVDGPATVWARNYLRETVAGKRALGMDTYEFEIVQAASGRRMVEKGAAPITGPLYGPVVVTITTTPPNGTPTMKVYRYDVEQLKAKVDILKIDAKDPKRPNIELPKKLDDPKK